MESFIFFFFVHEVAIKKPESVERTMRPKMKDALRFFTGLKLMAPLGADSHWANVLQAGRGHSCAQQYSSSVFKRNFFE